MSEHDRRQSTLLPRAPQRSTENPTVGASPQGVVGEGASLEPGTFDGVSSGWLGTALETLLAEPPEDGDLAPFVSAARSTVESSPLPTRAALWADVSFWQADWWAGSGQVSALWRQCVDPLLDLLQAPELEVARQIATVPGFRERMAAHPGLLDQLASRASGLEALAIRTELATGERPADEALALVEQWLHATTAGDLDPLLSSLRDEPQHAVVLAEQRWLMTELRGRRPEVAEEIDRLAFESLSGIGSLVDTGDEATNSASWLERVLDPIEQVVRSVLSAVERGGDYVDPGSGVLAALCSGQQRLFRLASADGVSSAQAAARTQLAQETVGHRVAESLPLQELLDRVEDLRIERRIAQLLGLETDYSLQIVANGSGLTLAQVERFQHMGAELARAVVNRDEAAAIAVSVVAQEEYLEVLQEVPAQDQEARLAVQQALVAGYASVGGDLAHGLASFETGNAIVQRLSFDSLAIAQKSADDHRDNRVVQADWDLDDLIQDLFTDLHKGDGTAVLRRTRAGRDGLMLPAQVLAPDDRFGLIQERYRANHGISLGDHIERSSLTPAVKTELAERLGVSAFRDACTRDEPLPERAVLQPEFFEIRGQPIPGIEDDAPEFERVRVATDAHVAYLRGVLSDVHVSDYGTDIAAYDTHKALTDYLATLAPSGGKPMVLEAFELAMGASLTYYLQTLQLDGFLDERTAAVAERLVDAGALHPVSAELRGEADANQWDAVLATVNDPSFADARAAVLGDGETLAYMRRKAPNEHAWDLFYRSATGELRDAELIERDGGLLHGLAQWVPNVDSYGWGRDAALWALGTDEDDIRAQLDNPGERAWDPDHLPTWLLTGDESERFDVDTAGLLALRDDGLEGEALEQRRLERLTDPDVQYRLGRRHGEGDKRYLAEMGLLDRSKQGQAVESSTHWWGTWETTREAILGMSEAERAEAQSDPLFLREIDEMTASDPAARQRLLDVLYNGEQGAWKDQLLDAEGHAMTGYFGLWLEPWKAVDALAKVPPHERAQLPPETQERFRAATKNDPDATERIEALLAASRELAAGDPDACLRAFAAEHTAALTVALASGSDEDVATSLVSFAEAVDEQRDPDAVARSVSGWQIRDLAGVMAGPVHARSKLRYAGWLSVENGRSVQYMQLFHRAARGDTRIAVRVLAEFGAQDSDVLLALIKSASDDIVAREWASLQRPTREGDPSLASVYATYRSARVAAESKPPGSAEAGAAQRALVALQSTRVDLSDRALSISLLQRQSGVASWHADLEAMSPAAWEKARKAVRERIGKLPASLVHTVVGVDPEDAGVVWTPQMRLGLVTAEMVDQTGTSLSETSWGFEQLTSADNEAALHYAVFAQQAEQGVGTEGDLRRMRSLATEAQGTLAEYDAARKTAADLTSFAATLMVTAVTAVLTGPGAGPALASAISLGSSALSGLASIAIKESIQGSRYDSEEGLKTLVIDLAKEAVTLGSSEVWDAMLAANAFAEIPLGAVPRFLHKAQTSAEGVFGEPATAIALAGAAVPWQGVRAAAWAGVEEGVAGRGWAAGVDRGMLVLEGKLQALPEDVARGMLAEVASQLGEAAVADPSSPSSRQLTGLSAEQQLSRKTLAELIEAKLAGVQGKVFESGLKTLVEKGSGLALSELMDAAQTGQHNLTDDEVMGVFGAALKAMAKSGAKETGKAVGGGMRAFASQERQATARELMGDDAARGVSDRAFLAWVGSASVPLGSAADLVAARSQFDAAVWDVAIGRLESQRPDGPDAQFAMYEAWVMDDPSKVATRVSGTDFATFRERLSAVETDLLQQQASPGYFELSDEEQRWFDEASERPWLLADLSGDNADVVLDVTTEAGRERFRGGIVKARETLAKSWVERWAADVGGRRGAFAREHISYISQGVYAVPGGELDGYQIISERVRDAQRVSAMAQQAGLHTE